MNKVVAMTAIAAGLLVSSAALAAPANLADAFAPDGALTLVRGGGGGGGGGHMGGSGGSFGGGGHLGDNGGAHFSGGNAGAHFSGGDHFGGGAQRGVGAGPRLGANDHFDNGHGHIDHDHFDHGRGRHGRFPSDVFVYGGDYADYGYAGDCSWLRREARATGSAYWWRRYQQCL